jgi:folate-dependent phosphoribosylglycinamide formyltransferase PurN
MSADARPIRVVVFGGAYLEPRAREFVARVSAHPEIELVGLICQSPGFGFRHRFLNVMRRRGVMAVPVLGVELAGEVGRYLRRPRRARALRRRLREVLGDALTVPKIHAPEVLAHVRALAPDLGLIYGSPILRPELFEIPRMGTLGIHQGTLPHYRGKKTTFWAMYNGEASAGVAIQKVNAGLDAGEIVRAGEVAVAGKPYGQVDDEVQALGIKLYLDAILAVKHGRATFRPQPPGEPVLYRQPSARQIIELAWRVLTGGNGPK